MDYRWIPLIILGGYIIAFIIYCISRLVFDEIKKHYFQTKCEQSYDFIVKYPGLYTCIAGEIGAGKTTMASGITNYFTIFKMQQASDKIEEIKIKYPDVDFNRINETIEYLYKYGDGEIKHITNSAYISSYILSQTISDKDKRTYEDVFGGPLKFKLSDYEIDYNSIFYHDNIKYFKNVKGQVIDSKGFLLSDSFEKIPVFNKSIEYCRDKDGIIKFDDFFNPLVDKEVDETEQARDLVYVDNYLSYVDGYQMLRDYIAAYVALLRNNYVFFINRKFYSHITHNYAYDFDEKLLDIKDCFLAKQYSVNMYSSLFWDEVALSGNKSTNFQQYAANDTGSDAFLRLVRQIGKNTINVIKTIQDTDRMVKAERELLTSVMFINTRHEIVISKFKFTILKFFYKLLIKYNNYLTEQISAIKSYKLKVKSKKIARKLIDFDETNPDKEVIKYFNDLKNKYDSRSTKLRFLLNKLSNKIDKLFASGILAYKGTLYYNADDVGKSNLAKNRKIDFTLFFPIRYCYGSTDTYAYSIIGDYLQIRSKDFNNYVEDSNEYPESISNNREIFVTKILTKDSVKNEFNKNIRDKAKQKIKGNSAFEFWA